MSRQSRLQTTLCIGICQKLVPHVGTSKQCIPGNGCHNVMSWIKGPASYIGLYEHLFVLLEVTLFYQRRCCVGKATMWAFCTYIFQADSVLSVRKKHAVG